MIGRRSPLCLLIGALLLFGSSAGAAPRDTSANQKIEEAIDDHYLGTDFDTAEGLLLGVIAACEDRCSTQVVARAWMYVGIVRGSARRDLVRATEAFRSALTMNAEARLDEGLATPEVQALWTDVRAQLGLAPELQVAEPSVSTSPTALGQDPSAATPAVAPRPAPPGGMSCTPLVTELESRRAYPLTCMTAEAATRAEVRYKGVGRTEWRTAAMLHREGKWLAEIPCSAAGSVGVLQWYVRARNQEGEIVDNYGTVDTHTEVSVRHTSSQPPPSYPGVPASARCFGPGECPDDMLGTPVCPGTKAVTADATDAADTADAGPHCEVDADCAAGTCQESQCVVTQPTSDSAQRPHLSTFGVFLGHDIVFGEPATNLCSAAEGSSPPGGYVCTQNSQRYPSLDSETTADDRRVLRDASVPGGVLSGTTRLMLSYERLVWEALALEARAGVAFGGAQWGELFLPIHLEGRAHWMLGATTPSPSAGVLGLFGVQAGVAQFDGAQEAPIDDTLATDPDPLPGPTDNPCDGSVVPPSSENPDWRNVRCGLDGNRVVARKQLGAGFVGAHVSVRVTLPATTAPVWGLQADVNINYTFPSNHFIIAPTLGATLSF